ncbi:hypothetical protein [Hyphomicrobium sp.]|uniref:hypothetical protein n=1 Tax=Hyphomicrobium sp. TaxID=82 RepID=UPI001D60AE48|nr:hypothetical protein [Hyphomicrobium sp.]MBY0561545.1 hypothetical protein [Hyphomicrobium sp.]
MKHFYLSFADETFLGATVVQGHDLVDAVRNAWDLGLNPGGQVLGGEVPEEMLTQPDIAICIGRLATAEELHALGAQSLKDMPEDKQREIEKVAERGCACCNGKIRGHVH